MKKMVRELIAARVKELRQSNKAISLKSISLQLSDSEGNRRNPAYLQQYITREVPKYLPATERGQIARILDIDEELLREVETLKAEKRAAVRIEKFRNVIAPPDPKATKRITTFRNSAIPSQPVSATLDNIKRTELSLLDAQSLPVFGTVQGGREGSEMLTSQAVTYVDRPDSLDRVSGAYGMIVTGGSMDPVMRVGNIICINPHIPPREGDFCVFRAPSEDDESVCVLVKEFLSQDADCWIVREYWPRKVEMKLYRKLWTVCHVVVATDYRR